MIHRDIHDVHDFFEYVRVDGNGIPPAAGSRIDVALLDMNHRWPNVGHDALVHAVMELSEGHREALVDAKMRVRVLSFDVRGRGVLPPPPGRQFQLYIGTGGPGHLDPRLNDGVSEWSQGIDETSSWEAPLFHLFDAIQRANDAAMFAVCHTFGLLCRWSGVARPELRGPEKGGKSSGMPFNVLTQSGRTHPWFSRFAGTLPDGRHFRVVDNRLFDLIYERSDATVIATESEKYSDALTMVEFARETASQMPRILGVNHHPEIIDREHLRTVLDEKRAHAEVTEQWYQERSRTLVTEFQGAAEAESQRTSQFTLLGPVDHVLRRLIAERRDALGHPAGVAALEVR